MGSDPLPQQSLVAVYCPQCQDVYGAPFKTDGVAWGPWNHHLMLMSMRDTMLKDQQPPKWQTYEKRYFGFRIQPGSPLAPKASAHILGPSWPFI